MERAENFDIGGKSVGAGSQCFVIAEAGVAHFGDFEKARSLVDLAVRGGADAVKFQTFDVDTLISKEAPEWRERLGSRCLTPEKFADLKDYCDKSGIIFLSTAHDEKGLRIVEDLQPPAYKIGSGELGNWEFIDRVARIGKPVILSTGMYSIDEVRTALQTIDATGNNCVALLHCVTSYPTLPSEVNLRTIELYDKMFGGVIGYSDHTEGSTAVIGAVALGAKIIEKHIALEFNVPDAQDWRVSSGPRTFARLVERVRKVELCRGEGGVKQISDSEKRNRKWACKSLVLRKDLKKGRQIESSMLVAKRPGTGISPADATKVIGRRAAIALVADTVLKWEDLE
jgi:N,N'-diacetyllegionaminate synthase